MNVPSQPTGRDAPSVSFRESCEVFLLRNRTEEMSYEIWYSEEEINGIMTENVRTVREVRTRLKEQSSAAVVDIEQEDDGGLCARGLEVFFSPVSLELRKTSQKLAMSVVLREQDRQRRMRIRNPEELRKSSMRASAAAVDRALRYALDDATFVRRERAVLMAAITEQSVSGTRYGSIPSSLQSTRHQAKGGRSCGETLKAALQIIDSSEELIKVNAAVTGETRTFSKLRQSITRLTEESDSHSTPATTSQSNV